MKLAKLNKGLLFYKVSLNKCHYIREEKIRTFEENLKYIFVRYIKNEGFTFKRNKNVCSDFIRQFPHFICTQFKNKVLLQNCVR